MVQLSYCQKTYPQKTIINGDTLVLITPIQVTQLNLTYLEVDKLNNRISYLNGRAKRRTDLIKLYKGKVSLLQQQVDLQNGLKNDLNEQIINLEKQNKIMLEISEQYKGDKFKGFLFGGIVSLGVVGIISLL